MATQIRKIYITGDADIDRHLSDIAARLDVIEGLRPDLSTGYYQLQNGKLIQTTDLDAVYQALDDQVIIGDGSITITSAAGNSIVIDGKFIEIKDAGGNVIFMIGSWT